MGLVRAGDIVTVSLVLSGLWLSTHDAMAQDATEESATQEAATTPGDAETSGPEEESGSGAAVTQVEPEPPDLAEQLELVEEARLLFFAGQRAFEAGRYEGALSSFTRAYELTGNAELLYNIGVTADRLRRDEAAVEAFEGYLEAHPETSDSDMIEGRIRILREQIARRDLEASQASEQAQEAAASPSPVDPDPATDDTDGGGVLSQWWFWTLAAVVVGAGVVATLVLTASPEDPTPGSEGVVIRALVDL